MVPSQTGRFSRAFVPSGFVGQGGFGRVYRAVHTQQQHACAVKVIPAKLRQGETIEQKDDVWSGGAVFEKLRIMSAPNVVRYYDYWLEEINPLAPETGAQAAAAAANLQVPCMPQAAMVAEDDGDSPWDSMSPRSPWSSASLDSVSNPDGFEWEQSDEAEECLDDAPGGNPYAAAGSLPQAAVAADAEDMFLLVSMEFCDGITLHEWLFDPEKPTGGKKAKSTPMEDALDLARQLLQGLSDLHEASIVHRDIKPANLLIESSSGRLRIFDFGLSRLTSSSVSSPASGASPLPTPAVPAPQRSNRGLVVGSPGYLAPEQGEAAAAHPSADVFSAGVVLVELFIAAARRAHGRPVWETAMERANAIRSLHEPDACPPPEELDALPTQLRTLLSLMTHPDASTRPTAAEALELIQQPVL